MTNQLSVPAESIKMVDLDKVKPNPKNPRTMSDSEREKLEESILSFGLVEPLVVNKDMTIIGGHQRYFVLLDLVTEGKVQADKVPVVVFEGDERKQMLLNIALNKISGQFDYRQLSAWILEQAETPEDLDALTLSGFTREELAALSKASDEWLDGLGEANGKTGDVMQLAAFMSESEKEATMTARKVGDWVARYASIPVDLIDPNDWNPNVMPDSRFNALKTSIESLGLVQPIMVRPREGRYQIIDGEKRWTACKALGWERVPCQIADIKDDRYAMAQCLAANKLAGFFRVDNLVPLLNRLVGEVGERELRSLTGWSDLTSYTGLEKVPEAGDFVPPGEIEDIESGVAPREIQPMVTLMLNLSWDDNEFVVNVLRQLSDDLAQALLICCKACLKRMEDGTTDEIMEEMGCGGCAEDAKAYDGKKSDSDEDIPELVAAEDLIPEELEEMPADF